MGKIEEKFLEGSALRLIAYVKRTSYAKNIANFLCSFMPFSSTLLSNK